MFQVTPDISANVDWWSVNREGTIQSFGLTELSSVNNYPFFQQNFLRDTAGNLLGVDTRFVNAGETQTAGMEAGLRVATLQGGARWAASFDVAYLLKKRSRITPAAAFGNSEVGVFTRAGDLGIRWKHTASITRTEGDWSATLTQVYRGKYADFVLPGVANGSVRPANWTPIVRPYEVFNASVGYNGIKNMSIVVGMKNIFNEDPPFSVTYDTDTGAGSSWESRVADPRGRAYTLRVEYKFF